MQSSRFFVVTGIDGAGKTSLLARLRELRPEWAISSYQPADWLPDAELPHFDWELERHPKTVVHRLHPGSRATFFLNMFFAHLEYWIKPRLEAGRVVVMDSYYYRFAAKERVLGRVPQFFYEALDELPEAGTIVVAELDPAVAAERKRVFDTHEVFDEPSEESFLAFQRAVVDELEPILEASGARLERVDASRPPEQLAREVLDRIESRLASIGAEESTAAGGAVS